ncbi:hypothetical protein OAH12_03115, partial [Cyclobacteriaceae bacterium]|nr:hypothetical protein [Cyclobacteriaceae bacterium]
MKKALAYIAVVFHAIVGFAQTPSNDVQDTIFIKYELEIQVDTAQRAYHDSPTDIRDFKASVTPQEYSSKDFDAKLEDENPKIKIYKIGTSPKKELLGNYVKAGYGPLYATPYLEVMTNSKQNEKLQYGAYYHHMSSNKGSV